MISSEAFLNRQPQYDFGSMPTINAHLAQALEDGDEASFLAVLGNVYGG
jgi:DNA-binding phage protein